MDTVYNDGSNGPFIQTFKFLSFPFFFAVYHDHKTADEMVKGVDYLESILGRTLVRQKCVRPSDGSGNGILFPRAYGDPR